MSSATNLVRRDHWFSLLCLSNPKRTELFSVLCLFSQSLVHNAIIQPLAIATQEPLLYWSSWLFFGQQCWSYLLKPRYCYSYHRWTFERRLGITRAWQGTSQAGMKDIVPLITSTLLTFWIESRLTGTTFICWQQETRDCYLLLSICSYSSNCQDYSWCIEWNCTCSRAYS